MPTELERLLAPKEETGDPLVNDLRRQQRNEVALAIVTDGDPNSAGKANQLSRRLGVPPETVERNLSRFEAADRGRVAAEMALRYPAMGKWTAQQRNAAVARDDIYNLARISEAFRVHYESKPEKPRSFLGRVADVARSLPAGITSGVSLTGKGTADFIDMQRRWMLFAGPFGQLAAAEAARVALGGDPGLLRRGAEDVEAAAEWMRPARENRNIATDVSEGVGQVVLQITAAILSGGAATIPTLAAQGAGQMGDRAKRNNQYGTIQSDIGILIGAPATAAAEKVQLDFLLRYVPPKVRDKVIGRLTDVLISGGSEALQETVEGVMQNLTERVLLNPDRDILEGLDREAVAAGGTGAIIRSLVLLATKGRGRATVEQREAEAAEAKSEASFIREMMDGAAESQVRQRDPYAFEQFIAEHSQGTEVENIYIPGEKLRELYQSSDFEDGGFYDRHASEIAEAAEAQGDVVIPLSEAAAHLAGTPLWEQVRDDVRLSPGGLSLNEAKSFDEARAVELERMGESIAAETEAERAALEPRQKIAEAVRDKLMLAGFRPDVAANYAELWAARYATRAERMGSELTGTEADAIDVRQVLPEKLARAIIPTKPDAPPDEGLLAVIEIMKGKKAPRSDKAKFGPSLLDWIASKGGIEDRGGDLKAMGLAGMKGKARKGERKLIRAHNVGQASMLGADGQENSNSPDELALRAWEAGYFPEFAERPSVNDLLDAIAEGISGRERFAEDNTGEQDQLREAAQELYALLDQQGLDPDTATPQEIKRAVEQYQAERMRGRGYEQLFIDPEQPFRRMTPEQRAEMEARQQQ